MTGVLGVLGSDDPLNTPNVSSLSQARKKPLAEGCRSRIALGNEYGLAKESSASRRNVVARGCNCKENRWCESTVKKMPGRQPVSTWSCSPQVRRAHVAQWLEVLCVTRGQWFDLALKAHQAIHSSGVGKLVPD
ncbi:hypothetical protein KIN20_022298, partial [Parelaphostrongylus tenuis]